MQDTRYIDIRGLVTGEGKAHQFRIDEIYIPLQTKGLGLDREADREKRKPDSKAMVSREIPLEKALSQQKLIIRGDPGSGKTTFLRLISFLLCLKRLGLKSKLPMSDLLWLKNPPLPIYIRLERLTDHIRESKSSNQVATPTQVDSPEWLLHFLSSQSRELNWKVRVEDFRKELDAGNCLVLLDGLDEAPDPTMRKQVSSLAENLLKAFPKCQVVLSSRPAALVGEAVASDFEMTDIAPLDEPAMKSFLTKWSEALYDDAPDKAKTYQAELGEAIQSRPEIRRMARTPVMLTALAVVHWNEHRLPEQRAELYESILTWLCYTHAHRPGRLNVMRCRKLLQKLALAMFTHPEGRQRQVTIRWAAESLAPEFDVTEKQHPVESAERFLRDEIVDSGIIVERGNFLEFWHLSFQEYLAACEIAGKLEKDQEILLFANERLYNSEWREVVLLLGSVLFKQGEEKINHLVDSIITKGPESSMSETLPRMAGEVSLLGGIVRDLSIFDFRPKNPNYEDIVRSIMGIFDMDTFRNIPVRTRIEAADALAQVGDPRLERDPMVEICEGRFWRGAQRNNPAEQNFDEEADDDESPVHEVELAPFSISKYPITVDQYRRFIEDSRYTEERYRGMGEFVEFEKPKNWEDQLQYPSRPVLYVSWYEAVAYTTWAGGRLPTEAEWERAARGQREKYCKFPWGNDEPSGETANYNVSGIGHVTPVGIFPLSCSPEGAIDMAGNVWEWCHDWFNEHYYIECAEKNLIRNPRGPNSGKYRVLRGGSFFSNPGSLRCSSREGVDPHYHGFDVGFRIVRVL